MEIKKLNSFMYEFNLSTHGTTTYDKDNIFVIDEKKKFTPLNYLKKKIPSLKEDTLIREGFIFDSLDLIENENFIEWYEEQFGKKIKRAHLKKVLFLYRPDNKIIFDTIESINRNYEILREQNILFNGKKLPVQLGEWYIKCIFSIVQKKSTSQRGFDFYIGDKRVEVKVQWGDKTSPKGVKLRKSLVELSAFCIIIYLAKNLMIREICFLDAEFVGRKFSGKGHIIFLKDLDIISYFFSKSGKHKDKVVNSNALLKYSRPKFAMKLIEKFSF